MKKKAPPITKLERLATEHAPMLLPGKNYICTKQMLIALIDAYGAKQLASIFKVTEQAIHWYRRKNGLSKGARSFIKIIIDDGYKSLADFFTCPAITKLSFREIGKKYKVLGETVSRHYKKFLEESKNVRNEKQ